MKIVLEQPADGEEDQIIVKCRDITAELMNMIAAVKSGYDKMTVYDGNEIHRISPGIIYYFEAVDNKIFLYCKEKVCESKQKLYELEGLFANSDFIRVSKSVILNLKKIKSLAPAYSGRFEATLLNDEKIIISRQYVPELKKKLKI